MTLGIMIATSSGIVICTDSLVTTSKTNTFLKDYRNRIELPKDIWENFNEGEFGYATPNSNLTTMDSVISTSPNVKKMFQIGNHSIAFTLAGENHWKYTIADKEGVLVDFPIPMDSYVETVAQYVIGELPEDASFEDIVNSLGFVLNYGQLYGNQNYSENKKSSIYSIMGGGYGKNDSYPRAFSYQMPGGDATQSVLNACYHSFSIALSASFIQSCCSTNWFDEYCENYLMPAIDSVHAQAWVWGVHYNWSPQTIIEQLIPDVNENITNCLMALKEFTSNDPHGFLQVKNLSTPKIISRFWNLYRSSSSRNEIESLVSKFNNVTPRMLELIELENPRKHVIAFRDSVDDYIFKTFPIGYKEQSEKVRKSITNIGFNAMWGILNGIVPSFMLSLSQICKTSNSSIEFSGTMWTGLRHVGNAEVIEKITNGMDANTFWKLSDDIKTYQMHAAERLATIISHKIQSKEIPEYIPYGKEARNEGGDKKPNSSEEVPTHVQLTLPLSDEVVSDNEVAKRFDLSGLWKGFYTGLNEFGKESKKFQFELEMTYTDGKMYNGEYSQNSMSSISLIKGELIDENQIRFDMILDGNQLTQIQVDCEIKAWGIEGSFELEGNRESLIMHRNDSNSNIDSEKLTSDALNQLVRELERMHPEIKTWDVNYNTLPLESAVEMVHYLMNSTVMKQRFNLELPSVGGPIRTLIITRNEGVMPIQDYEV